MILAARGAAAKRGAAKPKGGKRGKASERRAKSQADEPKRKSKSDQSKPDRKKTKKTKGKGKGKGSKAKKARKPARTAKTSDRHELYQLSVQAPEVDAPFFAKYHLKVTGRPARVLREDFCGTAYLAAHWVTLHRENQAIGVDLDGPTLDWGRKHIIAALDEGQQARIELHRADVSLVRTAACDVIVALNFSYSFFMTRETLRGYFEHARQDIRPGGLLMLDAWGGSETLVEQEEERDVEDFVYVWDQHRFDPMTHISECRIHFRFRDGSEMKNAFRYTWRQWTLPELTELMREAGFDDVHVLWEGTDRKTGEGNGIYRRANRGEADPAWIAYVVGRA